jgi:hypothetical protein
MFGAAFVCIMLLTPQYVFPSRLEIFRCGGVAEEEEVGEDSESLERVSFPEIK